MPPPVVPDSEEPSEEEEEPVPVVPESEEDSLPVEPEEEPELEPVSVEPLPLEELLGSVEVESRPLLDDGGIEGPELVLGSPDSELPPLVEGGASLHAVAVRRPETTSAERRIDGIVSLVVTAPS